MSTAYSSAKQQYIGNGVTTEWGFDFPIQKHSELKVYLKRSEMPQVLLEEGVDYSFVTENTIAFPIKTGEAKLQAADVLALQRESVFESEYNFSNQQRLEPEEVMHADDNLERQIQELKRDVTQAIRIQPTSNIDTDEYFIAVESIYENLDNITNVSGISAEIVNCSDNISDISAVSSNIANVNAVGQSISNVNTVAGDISSVNTVAGVSTDVTAVAGIASSVPTVANNDANITTVATNISDVNTAASNIEAIKAAPTAATNAANSATDSANSATSASASAQAAQNALNEVQGLIATPIGTIFQSVYVDESLDIARQLNGQLISSTKFTGFRSWLNTVQASLPNLFTTETNWQAEKTNSKLGQCGKFVVDDTAGTIRLPVVVNAQGLLSLSGIGNLVNESLPNITGSARLDNGIIGTYFDGATGAFYKGSTWTQSGQRGTTGNAGALYYSGFDASRSSSTYQDNAPVQQEAVQYPYYIQVATGVEETLPAIREYNINTPFFFGQSMYSDVASDNASWLVSNGSYNSRSVYPDYYDWLLEQRNAELKTMYGWHRTTDTQIVFLTLTNTLSVGTEFYGYVPTVKAGTITAISGNNVTGKNDIDNTTSTTAIDVSDPVLIENQYIYDTTKVNIITKSELDNWRGSINTSDYDFVINTENQTFRLPLLNGEEDLRGSVTESVSGAVSDSGTLSFTAAKNGWLFGKSFSASGASLITFSIDGLEICRTHASPGEAATIEAFIKAGQIIYVQFNSLLFLKFTPAIGNGSLYYYVGDTVQDASLINAGAVLGQLSDKISRTAVADKELVVGWGMPDYTAGVSASSGYTAPKNGWVIIRQYTNNNNSTVNIGGVDVSYQGSASSAEVDRIYPISKGQSVTGLLSHLVYYPCKGV